MTTVEQSHTRQSETPHTGAAPAAPFGAGHDTPNIGSFGVPEALFRFPAPDDPAPATRRLLGMSLVSAALGLTGVWVGAVELVTALGGAPFWYMPALALLGLVSVLSAVGSFLSIHRKVLPWVLLAGSAVPMAGALLVAAVF